MTHLSRVSIATMEDRDQPSSSAADIIGLIGLSFAILGLADVALLYRLGCLLGASVCLPVSFHRQNAWPEWVRWALSLVALCFLFCVSWMAVKRSS